MEQGRGRKRLRRAATVGVLVLAAAGTWAGFNSTLLRAKYAAYKFRSAATDEERTRWADDLAGRGDAGLPLLVEALRSGEPTSRAAAAALSRHLDSLPDSDPQAIRLGGQLLDAFPHCDEAGRAAVLELVPAILKRGGTTHAAKCREIVVAGLKLPAMDARLRAIRVAMHPAIKAQAELLPLLDAPEAEVRRAALFAVGPAADGEPVIGDEELFRWLHDPDAGVRSVCREALVSRGRQEAEISLGRRLTHPDAGERLELLRILRHDDDVADPEPWLERLSRDADPAVRAGAARTAVEVVTERRVPVPSWVGRLADADEYAAVRVIARFYRAQPASPDRNLRPAGGP